MEKNGIRKGDKEDFIILMVPAQLLGFLARAPGEWRKAGTSFSLSCSFFCLVLKLLGIQSPRPHPN